MDHLFSIDTLRSLSTVLAFVAFIAVCVWAYSKKRHADFEQAANLPFADEHSASGNFVHDRLVKNRGEKNS